MPERRPREPVGDANLPSIAPAVVVTPSYSMTLKPRSGLHRRGLRAFWDDVAKGLEQPLVGQDRRGHGLA